MHAQSLHIAMLCFQRLDNSRQFKLPVTAITPGLHLYELQTFVGGHINCFLIFVRDELSLVECVGLASMQLFVEDPLI